MSSKRVRIILLSGVILLALIVGVSLILTYGFRKTLITSLPSDESSGISTPATTGDVSGNVLKDVTVDTDNVQTVIGTLKRPQSYSRNIVAVNYYGNESTTYNISVAVKGSSTAMKIDGAGTIEYVVLSGDKLYAWYDNDKDYYAGPAKELGDGTRTSDEFQKIITYEDVLGLDKSRILDAGFTTSGGEDCIYVKYRSETLSYTTIAYISVKSGLLTEAEQYDGATPVYRMTTSSFNQTEPADAAFSLPDGKNALSAP